MDEGFISRTYRTSAWVLLLVGIYLLGLGKFRAAWSVTAGACLGLIVLRGFEWFVRRVFVPGRKPRPWLMLQVAFLKLPALALVLYLVVHSGWFHLPAFAAGVALIHTVIFLKAVGAYQTQQQEDAARARQAATAGGRRLSRG